MNTRRAEGSARVTLWKAVLLALAVFVNLTLAWRLVWGPQSLVTYRELRAQYESLEQEVARYDGINAALSREIRLLQTDAAYVEKVIRQRLNFVRDDEILYLFTEEPQSSGATLHEGKN